MAKKGSGLNDERARINTRYAAKVAGERDHFRAKGGEAEAKRDRYREALELIRDELETTAHMREVAREALDG